MTTAFTLSGHAAGNRGLGPFDSAFAKRTTRALQAIIGAGTYDVITTIGFTCPNGGTAINPDNTANGDVTEWWSDTLSASVTIAGTITCSITGLESAMTVNCGPAITIFQWNSGLGTLTQIADGAGIEYGTVAAAVTISLTPTSTTLSPGDRIVIRMQARNVGTMAAGTATVTLTGDVSTVTFTETITTSVISGNAAGTRLHLSSTASDLASYLVLSLTEPGGTVATSTTTLTAAPSSLIQATNTAGGSTLQWITPTLNGFTLDRSTAGIQFEIGGGGGTAAARFAYALISATDSTGADVGGIGAYGFSAPGNVVGSFQASHSVVVPQGGRIKLVLYWGNETTGTDSNAAAMGAGTGIFKYNGTRAALTTTDIVLNDTVTAGSPAVTSRPYRSVYRQLLAQCVQLKNGLYGPRRGLWLPRREIVLANDLILRSLG